jgi:hypothetical protein
MTRKSNHADRPPRTNGRTNADASNGNRYSAEAVEREIDKDLRIKPREARLIHALLKGRY